MIDYDYLRDHWIPSVEAHYDRGGVMVLKELSIDGKRYITRRILTRAEALTRPLPSKRWVIQDVAPGEPLPEVEADNMPMQAALL